MSTSPLTPDPRSGAARVRAILGKSEDLLSVFLIALAAVLSILPVLTRTLSVPGIRGSADYIQHLVLWIAFAGGAIATRESRHLALSFGVDLMKKEMKDWVRVFTSFVDILFLTVLTLSSLSFSLLGFETGSWVGVIPTWILVPHHAGGFLAMGVPHPCALIAPPAAPPDLALSESSRGSPSGLRPCQTCSPSAGRSGRAFSAAQAALAPVD